MSSIFCSSHCLLDSQDDRIPFGMGKRDNAIAGEGFGLDGETLDPADIEAAPFRQSPTLGLSQELPAQQLTTAICDAIDVRFTGAG